MSTKDHDANHNKLKLLYDTISTFIVSGLHFYLTISWKNSNSVIFIGQPFYTVKSLFFFSTHSDISSYLVIFSRITNEVKWRSTLWTWRR